MQPQIRQKSFENFPLWLVLVSNMFTILLYVSGTYIISTLSWLLAVCYLAYVLVLEFRLIKNHCTDCYYWGKVCGFGKGKLSALFFKKGDNSRFCNHTFTWKDLIPDMLVSALPILAGIVSLIISFKLAVLVSVVVIIALTTAGNSYVRGSLTCKYCMQREIGCPAERLFNANKGGDKINGKQ